MSTNPTTEQTLALLDKGMFTIRSACKDCGGGPVTVSHPAFLPRPGQDVAITWMLYCHACGSTYLQEAALDIWVGAEDAPPDLTDDEMDQILVSWAEGSVENPFEPDSLEADLFDAALDIESGVLYDLATRHSGESRGFLLGFLADRAEPAMTAVVEALKQCS